MAFDEPTIILAALFLGVGALYASVGHAGASGYLAVMALMGTAPEEMRPTALAVNVVVSIIAFAQFWRGGHFSWRFAWPFLVTAPPAAFVGAAIPLSTPAISMAIGLALVASFAKMVWDLMRVRSGATSVVREPSLGAAMSSSVAIGLAAGITGTGGGIFLSPLLLLMNWASPKRIAATSALFIFVTSIAGLGGLAQGGWKPHESLMLLAVAGAVGGLIGSYLGSRHLGLVWLRGGLALVVLVAGVKLVAI